MAFIPPVVWGAVASSAVGAGLNAALAPKPPKPPTPPAVPNAQSAANLAQQQEAILARRRGVLANIYSGNAGTPQVTKSTLG